MRGRKPKPVELKRLHGNPGKRRLPTETAPAKPRPQDPMPEPPAHLWTEAKAEWRRIVPELQASGLIQKVDHAAVAAYCAAYARWARAELKLKDLGGEWIVTTDFGTQQPTPWLAISNRAVELMHKFLVEFGMTASSRVRLGVRVGPKPSADGAPAGEPEPLAPGVNEDLAEFLARGGRRQ